MKRASIDRVTAAAAMAPDVTEAELGELPSLKRFKRCIDPLWGGIVDTSLAAQIEDDLECSSSEGEDSDDLDDEPECTLVRRVALRANRNFTPRSFAPTNPSITPGKAHSGALTELQFTNGQRRESNLFALGMAKATQPLRLETSWQQACFEFSERHAEPAFCSSNWPRACGWPGRGLFSAGLTIAT